MFLWSRWALRFWGAEALRELADRYEVPLETGLIDGDWDRGVRLL